MNTAIGLLVVAILLVVRREWGKLIDESVAAWSEKDYERLLAEYRALYEEPEDPYEEG